MGSALGTRENARNASSQLLPRQTFYFRLWKLWFTVIKQRLLGRKVGKMADDSEQEVTESISLDHEGLWKGKYFSLLKNCRQIEQVRLCSLRICQSPSERGTLKVFWILQNWCSFRRTRDWWIEFITLRRSLNVTENKEGKNGVVIVSILFHSDYIFFYVTYSMKQTWRDLWFQTMLV